MVDDLLSKARAGDGAAFRELTVTYRAELQVHCYRILGSVQDAEDQVQETMLAAWRGLHDFEGRSSLRSWLYRIATNRCLNALRARDRRPRQTIADLGQGFTQPSFVLNDEPTWLEPLPDALTATISPDPAAQWEVRESVSLAFVTAIQHLPPRQRATLLLRDVLGFHAAEVADILDTTVASVNGVLKRARATLATQHSRGTAGAPGSRDERELADRFARALEQGDIDGVVDLLADNVRLTMPPEPYVWQGRQAVTGFLTDRFRTHHYRFVPTQANGQPAFGLYRMDPNSVRAHAYGLLVLTINDDRRISKITRFLDNGVIARFGLPRMLHE